MGGDRQCTRRGGSCAWTGATLGRGVALPFRSRHKKSGRLPRRSFTLSRWVSRYSESGTCFLRHRAPTPWTDLLALEETRELPVAFFLQFFLRDEAQGGGVDAIAKAGGTGTVWEHVTEMRVAFFAA